MKRRMLIVTLITLTLLTAMAPASAATDATIDFGDHVEEDLSFNNRRDRTLHYDVEVTEGAPVNVYFTNATGRQEYINGKEDFFYYSEHSSLNVINASKEWVWDSSGKFWVIIENNGLNETQTSKVTYDVGYKDPDPSDLFLGLTAVVLAFLVLVAVVIVIATAWFLVQGVKAKREQEEKDEPPEGG